MQKQENDPRLLGMVMKDLADRYPEIQVYFKTAMHMQDTESCMVTLPCKNTGKHLMILAAEVG